MKTNEFDRPVGSGFSKNQTETWAAKTAQVAGRRGEKESDKTSAGGDHPLLQSSRVCVNRGDNRRSCEQPQWRQQ
ncbi:hypothetical protein Q5P01_026247 [Channa striata]|uniref:Uncharacterized protein n=1 Tax=Channa striata TaxID=64152 RepID=A0AA88J271_CHASR|nr:hypothetical protein Q5P01_026247 [Channa striata]